MARPPETTPCPGCAQAVPVPARKERGTCPHCGMAVRFVEAPERTCVACGKPMAVLPGSEAIRCAACGTWQASDGDPRRPVVAESTCPRCGRDVAVPLDGESAACPRCGATMLLGDSF